MADNKRKAVDAVESNDPAFHKKPKHTNSAVSFETGVSKAQLTDNLSNEDAVLRLLQHDLDYLEAQEQGEPQDRQSGDLAMAINLMREDILSTQATSQDRALARSTSEAIAGDQNILAAIRLQDRTNLMDRQYALALSEGRDPPALPYPDPAAPPPHESCDPISFTMNELNNQSMNAPPDDAAPRDAAQQVQASNPTQCASCLENFSESLFQNSCGHGYCRDCAKKIFTGATVDEQLFPPRCCGKAFPPAIALQLLDYTELRAFCAKAVEWSTENRLYCANKSCLAFIPPWAIENDLGTCQGCGMKTHSTCKSLEHGNRPCPEDNRLREVLEMAGAEGWKRCFNCQAMVELQFGCNHITCRCGREFCYVCSKVWRTCECRIWDESRIIHLANQIVREELPRNANEADRQVAFNRAVEDIRDREVIGCEHHRASQWVLRYRNDLECEMCGEEMGYYIYVCTNCQVSLCSACRRTRLR